MPKKTHKCLQVHSGEEAEAAGEVEVDMVDMVDQKTATTALEGEDVDEAATRVVGEVAATETARAVVVDMRQRRARRQR